MRIILALLALGLGSGAAHAAAFDSDPVSLIKAIYKTYEEDKAQPKHIYSKRLQALIDKDEKETPEGMVGRIDWDVFVDGQDWKLTELNITLVSKSADKAQVRATFKNFDHPSNMLFDLVHEDGLSASTTSSRRSCHAGPCRRSCSMLPTPFLTRPRTGIDRLTA